MWDRYCTDNVKHNCQSRDKKLILSVLTFSKIALPKENSQNDTKHHHNLC